MYCFDYFSEILQFLKDRILYDGYDRRINMICPNCKKEISDESIYCGYCGSKVVEEPKEEEAVTETIPLVKEEEAAVSVEDAVSESNEEVKEEPKEEPEKEKVPEAEKKEEPVQEPVMEKNEDTTKTTGKVPPHKHVVQHSFHVEWSEFRVIMECVRHPFHSEALAVLPAVLVATAGLLIEIQLFGGFQFGLVPWFVLCAITVTFEYLDDQDRFHFTKAFGAAMGRLVVPFLLCFISLVFQRSIMQTNSALYTLALAAYRLSFIQLAMNFMTNAKKLQAGVIFCLMACILFFTMLG